MATMDARDSYIFYPRRVFWRGIGILFFGGLLTLPFWCLLVTHVPPTRKISERREGEVKRAPLASFSGLQGKAPLFPIPDLQSELNFSFDSPRPDGSRASHQVLIRLKKGALSKRSTLPCRLDLKYQGGSLAFSEAPSFFWVDLEEKGKQIEGTAHFHLPGQEKMDGPRFLISPQECPIQTAQEFPEGSPFRYLAEARWLGRDLFKEQMQPVDPFFSLGSQKTEGNERIDLGNAGGMVELRSGEWLVWKENHWEKTEALKGEIVQPMVRVQERGGRGLILEGWDLNGYVRFALSPIAAPSVKVRGEDLFSSLRVRSEKQISCMLEKQCLVLKTGDWVLKTGGRWRVLRRKEEKEFFLNGKLVGDLFIFEQIATKQGQKVIQGRFFNMNRTYTTPIELIAQTKTRGSSKGKSR